MAPAYFCGAGYLPSDFDHAGWTADVDLYQLGLTMLQVSTYEILFSIVTVRFRRRR